jgi:hypothetical protein
MKKARSIFIAALAAWLVLTATVITVLTWPNPKVRAMLGMG